jgi:hypothetical protein
LCHHLLHCHQLAAAADLLAHTILRLLVYRLGLGVKGAAYAITCCTATNSLLLLLLMLLLLLSTMLCILFSGSALV